jgi:hypothetical protein
MPQVTFNAKPKKKPKPTEKPKHRPDKTRLSLTTKDLADFYQVKPDTVRHWLTLSKLNLECSPVQALINIVKLSQELEIDLSRVVEEAI